MVCLFLFTVSKQYKLWHIWRSVEKDVRSSNVNKQITLQCGITDFMHGLLMIHPDGIFWVKVTSLDHGKLLNTQFTNNYISLLSSIKCDGHVLRSDFRNYNSPDSWMWKMDKMKGVSCVDNGFATNFTKATRKIRKIASLQPYCFFIWNKNTVLPARDAQLETCPH